MKRPIKRWLCVSRILVAIHETEYGQVHEYMIGLDDLEGIALT